MQSCGKQKCTDIHFVSCSIQSICLCCCCLIAKQSDATNAVHHFRVCARACLSANITETVQCLNWKLKLWLRHQLQLSNDNYMDFWTCQCVSFYLVSTTKVQLKLWYQMLFTHMSNCKIVHLVCVWWTTIAASIVLGCGSVWFGMVLCLVLVWFILAWLSYPE